jgi:uncharacterized protein (TIGR02444 family)
LNAYARPGAAQACLALQDDHGQNVPLLLWAVWAQVRDPDLLGRAAVVAKAWDAMAVSPLRGARRALKSSVPPVADAAREGLRRDVKAAELRAEKVLMQTLEAMTGEPGGAAVADALAAAAAAWGKPLPRNALAALAAALG